MHLTDLKRRKSIGDYPQEIGYKRYLTAVDLILLGVGAIVGAGIFVLTGRVAHDNTGPAVVFSFLIAGVVSCFACLCYAEMASTLPFSGSAYSFAYATLGELVAWIIGWDLMLEYLVGAATVAVSWSGYLAYLMIDITGNNDFWNPIYINAPFIWLESGTTLPWDSKTVLQSSGFFSNYVKCSNNSEQFCQAIVNVPALLVVIACTAVLVYGVKQSITFNNALVCLKLVVILVFIGFGLFHLKAENYDPFIPEATGVRGQFGFSGIFEGSASVFFAYVGFDAVSTAAYEAKNPKRDLPIGIIGSLLICTLLYIIVSVVLTGMVKYTNIDIAAPVAAAVRLYAPIWLSLFIEIGALAGLTSVLMALLYGQPRIFQAMSQDGLFPAIFAKINSRTQTPVASIVTTGAFCGLLAALFPVSVLSSITSIGTLFAFFLVSLSTILLRITQPDLPRKFEIPGGRIVGGIVIPSISAVLSLGLLTQSTFASIMRVVIWLILGLIVYFSYGIHHSKLKKKS